MKKNPATKFYAWDCSLLSPMEQSRTGNPESPKQFSLIQKAAFPGFTPFSVVWHTLSVYCPIMQHLAETPLHRSTIWRREKRLSENRSSHVGRSQFSDFQQEGFFGFVATAISLLRKNGYCDYAEIFQRKLSGSRREYCHPIPGIYGELVKSKFPAPMLAVAICEIIPLNLITRGGPGASSKSATEWKARAIVRQQSGMISKFAAELRAVGYSSADIKKALPEFGAMPPDQQRKLIAEFARSRGEDASFVSWANQSKGTPPHRVNYCCGATLTRGMASYWRNHRNYRRCKVWLKSILPEETPLAPFRDRICYESKLLNAIVQQIARSRTNKKPWRSQRSP